MVAINVVGLSTNRLTSVRHRVCHESHRFFVRHIDTRLFFARSLFSLSLSFPPSFSVWNQAEHALGHFRRRYVSSWLAIRSILTSRAPRIAASDRDRREQRPRSGYHFRSRRRIDRSNRSDKSKPANERYKHSCFGKCAISCRSVRTKKIDDQWTSGSFNGGEAKRRKKRKMKPARHRVRRAFRQPARGRETCANAARKLSSRKRHALVHFRSDDRTLALGRATFHDRQNPHVASQLRSNTLRATFSSWLHPDGLFSTRNRPIRDGGNSPGSTSIVPPLLLRLCSGSNGWSNLVTPGCGFNRVDTAFPDLSSVFFLASRHETAAFLLRSLSFPRSHPSCSRSSALLHVASSIQTQLPHPLVSNYHAFSRVKKISSSIGPLTKNHNKWPIQSGREEDGDWSRGSATCLFYVLWRDRTFSLPPSSHLQRIERSIKLPEASHPPNVELISA